MKRTTMYCLTTEENGETLTWGLSHSKPSLKGLWPESQLLTPKFMSSPTEIELELFLSNEATGKHLTVSDASIPPKN